MRAPLHLKQKPLTRLYFELNLKRPQLPADLDLALAPEAQHLIAGKLLFGHRYYLLDLERFGGELEADGMRCAIVVEVCQDFYGG